MNNPNSWAMGSFVDVKFMSHYVYTYAISVNCLLSFIYPNRMIGKTIMRSFHNADNYLITKIRLTRKTDSPRICYLDVYSVSRSYDYLTILFDSYTALWGESGFHDTDMAGEVADEPEEEEILSTYTIGD